MSRVPCRSANVEKAVSCALPRPASAGADRLPARTVRRAISLPEREHARFGDAEPIPGPTAEALAAVARETGMVVVGSFFERRAAGIYHNTAVVFDADGSDGGHLSQDAHPRRPALLREVLLHARRPRVFQLDTRFGNIGTLRLLGPVVSRGRPTHGADGARDPLLSHGHRLAPRARKPSSARPTGAWETIRRSHAIANGCTSPPPTASATKGDIQFWGASFVADPFGNILARASHDADETLIIECNLDQIDVVRTQWPFFRDRRIDAYEGLTRALSRLSQPQPPALRHFV